jgi:uncharacterized protein (DUF952 family)
MLIYKILRPADWAALERDGETAGAPVDVADGFVHFSTSAQLAETLRRHFAGETGLMLLAVDADALGADLRWEPARQGELFPHLHRRLCRAEVLWVRPVPEAAGLALLE